MRIERTLKMNSSYDNYKHYKGLLSEACELFLKDEICIEELHERVVDFVGDYMLSKEILEQINGTI